MQANGSCVMLMRAGGLRLSLLPFDQAFEKRDQTGNEVQQRRRDGQLASCSARRIFSICFV